MMMMLAARLVKCANAQNQLRELVQQASGALGFGGQERSPDDAHDARLPPGTLGFGERSPDDAHDARLPPRQMRPTTWGFWCSKHLEH